MMAATTQVGLAVLLLLLAMLTWRDRETSLLFLVTVVVPVGWGFTFWNAWRRDERARADGTWSPAFAQTEQKRAYGLMGLSLLAWAVLAVAVYALT